MNNEYLAIYLNQEVKYPDAIEYMINNMNINTVEKDIGELVGYVLEDEPELLEKTRKDEIILTLICLLNISKQIFATKGIFSFDAESDMKKSEDEQLDTNVEGNILQQVHTVLVNCSLYFRKTLIPRCNWSIPVYYRKMISFKNEDRMMVQPLTEKEKTHIIYGLDIIVAGLKGFSDELKEANNIHY